MIKQKKIGVVRTDNHGLIYAACWAPFDRYEYRLAHGQLYILEDQSTPTIPQVDTTITGCWNVPVDDIKLSKEQFAKAFHCKAYDTLEEMADPALFDGIFIANCSWYGEDHVEYALPFIKAGIPLFIDKPFANNAANAKIIIDAAREYNTPIFSTSILMHVDANKRLVQKHLGDPKMVVSTFSSKMEQRNASVHTISNLLGAVWALKGEYEVVSAQYIGNEEGKNPDREKGNGEVYRILLKDGTIGIINCNDYNEYSFRLDVFGSTGVSTEYVTEPTLRYGIVDIAREFAKMIDDKIPPYHYDRIFEFVAIIDAALKSREENGREVTIQEIADDVGYQLGIPMEHKGVATKFGWW